VSFLIFLFVFAVLTFFQNAVFTAVSRSRNSGDVFYHWKWSLLSNSIWFIAQIFIMKMIWDAINDSSYWKIAAAGWVYVITTSSGSAWMMSRMLKSEQGKRRVGAGLQP
jgi:hypothetical protein